MPRWITLRTSCDGGTPFSRRLPSENGVETPAMKRKVGKMRS